MITRNAFSRKARVRRTILVLLAGTLSTFAIAQTSPAPVPPLNGIAHIAIRVKDIASSVAFYNKLGYEQAFAMNKGDVVTQSFIKINDTQFLELYPVNPQNPTQAQPEFMHLCFEGADLNAIHDYYVAEGLTPISVRKAGAGNLLFTLKGPDQFRDPQNIEYTQYQPGSLHSSDTGKHLGADRVATRMTVVTLAMQSPAAARDFYLDKLGFTSSAKDPMLLDLPGTSGEQVNIVVLDQLGAKSAITLTSPSLSRAEAHLKLQGVATKKTKTSLTLTDPDDNTITIVPAK